MNFPEKILENLKKTGRITVPGFGYFSLENSKAELIKEQNTILPPAKHIVFNTDYQAINPNFFTEISGSNLSNPNIIADFKNQTDYWKKLISEGVPFEIPELGRFTLQGEQIVFKGNRIVQENPDFYGLEEIHLQDIKNTPSTAYRTSQKAVWIGGILAVACLGTAAYFAKDTLLGKPSFGTQKLASPIKTVKKDSAVTSAKVSDSLRTDSLKKDSAKKAVPIKKAAVIRKSVPKKKWTNKKKYKKTSKWSKAKKRQTR